MADSARNALPQGGASFNKPSTDWAPASEAETPPRICSPMHLTRRRDLGIHLWDKKAQPTPLRPKPHELLPHAHEFQAFAFTKVNFMVVNGIEVYQARNL